MVKKIFLVISIAIIASACKNGGAPPQMATAPNPHEQAGIAAGVTGQEEGIEIEKIEGQVSLAQLFENSAEYKGKSILVKGKVVKVNPEIMGTNWVHIQDGTSFGDKFDLTVTTAANCTVGDILAFKGKISLNKDFGYGYQYEVIMENAEVVTE